MFVPPLHHFPDLGNKTCVILGTGTKQHAESLKPIYTALGPENVAALPGFDTSGRFTGKEKATCWRAFLKASSHVKYAIIQLGKTDRPTDEVKSRT